MTDPRALAKNLLSVPLTGRDYSNLRRVWAHFAARAGGLRMKFEEVAAGIEMMTNLHRVASAHVVCVQHETEGLMGGVTALALRGPRLITLLEASYRVRFAHSASVRAPLAALPRGRP